MCDWHYYGDSQRELADDRGKGMIGEGQRHWKVYRSGKICATVNV